ncbi:MAG: protease modulator HflC [Sedimentisphaerales bacterium]|jgi:membrane protease subunit HflC|nr:protease modulator HflC [Sedimentisphaerales bacterium]
MKSVAVTIFIVLVLAVLGLYLVSFQVREIESALVTTFGRPTREITKSGLYFKWPAPIQQIYKFDSRMRTFEADFGETTTKGAVPIIVNTYVVWRISEPLAFFNANEHGSTKEAERKLLSHINDTQNRIIGRHSFSEFVNSDPNQIKFPQIEVEMLNELQKTVADARYGVEIKTLGVKQLKISEDVSKDVFERMKAERNRRTEATIAQGNAEATKIKTNADSLKTELLAAAEARAKAIMGQGDAEAAKFYKMLEEEPKLAIFLRNIEALKQTLKERTTIVIPADAEPFTLLKKIPDITLNESNEPNKIADTQSR